MTKLRPLVAALLVLLLLPALGSCGRREEPPAGKQESFVERFKTFDVKDSGRWFISDGWTNGDWMANDFRAEQLSLTPEGLLLTLSRNAPGNEIGKKSNVKKAYAGAEIRTHQFYHYGYFEGRMRVPRGSGVVSGLFTYTPPDKNILVEEIDIEILGRNTKRVELTIHHGKRTERAIIDLPFDSADGFHTYGFDWQPGRVTWYVDGQKIHEMRGFVVPVPKRSQQFFLDLWNTDRLTDWVGELDETRAPWTLTVSCMAYAKTYPGKPICAEP